MDEPIVYVDTSQILEGKLDEVRARFTDLVGFVEANVPRAIAYRVYLDEDERRVTVVQVHPDRASLEQHLAVAGPRFTPFAGLLRLERIDVYGNPGDAVLARLRAKAEMLGSGTVTVHRLHAGFARLPAT